MRKISRFHPSSLEPSEVRTLATAQTRLLRQVIGAIDANRETDGSLQHVLLSGPAGSGKSFFLRALQVALAERGEGPPLILLPEEQRNITSPSRLLDEIRRRVEGHPDPARTGGWEKEDTEDWERATRQLHEAVSRTRNGPGAPLVVVGLENLDGLLDLAFPRRADRSRLRRFLAEAGSVMLIGTTRRPDLDRDYEGRLFHSFSHQELAPWRVEDLLEYLSRRRTRAGQGASPDTECRVRALQPFIPDTARMAVVVADLLEEHPDMGSVELLESIVDELTPDFRELCTRIPPKARLLYDALVRGGEPCSQSELAERVGTTQNRIAQHFAWLRENHVVVGERLAGSRAFRYRGADRLLVHFYRQRFLAPPALPSPLTAMIELLETSLDPDRLRHIPGDAAGLLAGSRDRANLFVEGERWIEAVGEIGDRSARSRALRALLTTLLQERVNPLLLGDLCALAQERFDGADRLAVEGVGRASECLELGDESPLHQVDPDVATAALVIVRALRPR